MNIVTTWSPEGCWQRVLTTRVCIVFISPRVRFWFWRQHHSGWRIVGMGYWRLAWPAPRKRTVLSVRADKAE